MEKLIALIDFILVAVFGGVQCNGSKGFHVVLIATTIYCKVVIFEPECVGKKFHCPVE